MIDQPKLSAEEWALVIELIERERGDLTVEIRHTRTRSLRDELRRREEMIGNLLERLRTAATT